MKQNKNNHNFNLEDMFILPENKGEAMLLKADKMPEMLAQIDEHFSKFEFLFSCRRLADFLKEKDCLNLDGSDEYVAHITNTLVGMKADTSRTGIFNVLNHSYGEELEVYGRPAQKMYESIYTFCIDHKLWEIIEKGPWSWPLFGLVSFVIKPTIAFNILEKHWKYDNGMKKHLSVLLSTQESFKKALVDYDKYMPCNSVGKDCMVGTTVVRETGSHFVMANTAWKTEATMTLINNMVYLAQHPEENCAANFSEVLQYIEVAEGYREEESLSGSPLIRIPEEDCIQFMAQALHYYTACYALKKASEALDERYKAFYPKDSDALSHLAVKCAMALSELTKTHNAAVLQRQEERIKKEAEEKKAKEEEMKKIKEKIKARHVKFEEEGFKLFSENNTYEKWIKESNGQEVDRFFIKATTPSDRLSFFKGLEELGLSNGKVRNTKNPAGVLRHIKLGDEEIGTDTLVEEAVGRVYRMSTPLTKKETLDITDTLFTLASSSISTANGISDGAEIPLVP